MGTNERNIAPGFDDVAQQMFFWEDAAKMVPPDELERLKNGEVRLGARVEYIQGEFGVTYFLVDL